MMWEVKNDNKKRWKIEINGERKWEWKKEKVEIKVEVENICEIKTSAK